ncbi:ABC transporter permease subunit [Lachnoclostridium sp.]|nr:ABC transporter permease subunit [Lachnoclostridium sp.]
MNKKIRKGDFFMLLPSIIPIAVLFIAPLVYSLVLAFSNPVVNESGKAIYTDGQYEYFYNAKINRYDQMDEDRSTGVVLKPFEIKSQTDVYKEVTDYGITNFKKFFSTKKYIITIWNTFKLVIPAAIIQFLLAFSMAYFLRGKIKGKLVYNTLIIFPLTLGALIIAAGMTNFFGAGGWFNSVLMTLGIIDKPIKILYSYWGTFISLIISGTPFLFSGFLPICEGIDPNLEIAAQTLGANPVKAFIKVFLPLAIPSLLSILSLNMVLNMATYPSAVLVGNPIGSTRLLAVAAFEEFQQNLNYNMAATISLVLTASQLLIIGVISAIRKKFYIGYGGSFK